MSSRVSGDAQSARVQGVVIIEARLAPTAAVQEAKVLRSDPLLDAGRARRGATSGVHADAAQRRAGARFMTVTVNFTPQ